MATLQHGTKAVAVAMAFVVIGCQFATSPRGSNTVSWGPVTPIQVGSSGATCIVQDWLSPGETLEQAVYCASPDACDTVPIVDGRLTLPGAPESGIGSLRLTVNGRQRVVPVLSKGEVVHTFLWDKNNLPRPKSLWPLWETTPDGSLLQFLRSRDFWNLCTQRRASSGQPSLPMGCGWRVDAGSVQRRPNVQRHGRMEFSGACEFPRAPKFECLCERPPNPCAHRRSCRRHGDGGRHARAPRVSHGCRDHSFGTLIHDCGAPPCSCLGRPGWRHRPRPFDSHGRQRSVD